MMRCELCKFWYEIVELDKAGLCKRFPPCILLDEDKENFITVRPRTNFDDWCGEFEKRGDE